MVYYINFTIVNLVLDFILCLTLKKTFKINASAIYILFLQIPTVAVSMVYLFCGVKFFFFILLKLVSLMLVCVLMAESYKFIDILSLYGMSLLLFFSVYGFGGFMIMFIETILNCSFKINVASNHSFIILIALILYLVANHFVLKRLLKSRKFNKFLSKVSFSIFGKHIEVTGLLDSGNSLFDTSSGLPVVVLSFQALKKEFPNLTFQEIVIHTKNYVNCVTANERAFKLPLIDVKHIEIECDKEKKKCNCVIAVTNQKFYDDKKFDCLLHRDFI